MSIGLGPSFEGSSLSNKECPILIEYLLSMSIVSPCRLNAYKQY